MISYNKIMQDSIFTKIINGQIPAHRIYEDDRTLAFLDIDPVTPGHSLVIPKAQVEFVWDLNDEDYQALMATTKKVARRLREVLGRKYVGQRIVGVDVPHAHVHVIAFDQASEFSRLSGGQAEPDHAALAALAEKLRF